MAKVEKRMTYVALRLERNLRRIEERVEDVITWT